jgi:diguanylate cyclase (GGDEF)-like protein
MDTTNSPLRPASHLATRKKPIMARAVVFVVVVVVSLFAVVAWNSLRARSVEMRKTRFEAASMARALSQHAEYTIKAVDVAVAGLVERAEADGTSIEALKRSHRLLATQAAQLPQLTGLFILDQDGNPIASSQSLLPRSMNTADREYFMHHRNNPEREAYIGPPVQTRGTATWAITVSRRIQRADGSFAGVAVASIKLDHFSKFYDSFDIGAAGSIFLLHHNGILVARRPFSESVIGGDLTNGPFFRAYRERGGASHGSMMLRSVLDDIYRLYSYHRLQSYPLVTGVALSKDEIFADWRSDTLHLFLAITLLGTALGLLGFRLIRQIDIREQLEAELLAAKRALEELNQTLERLAMQDELTGLANRRHFEVALADEFRRGRRGGSPLALLMIDVDYFKQYNDVYGHPAGDECLRAISMALRKEQRRAGDLTARYGGEEFAVLLPGAELAGALQVAENIRRAIQGLRIPQAFNPSGTVTVSVGVEACHPSEGCQAADLVQAADRSLYGAKSNGRNCVVANSEVFSG